MLRFFAAFLLTVVAFSSITRAAYEEPADAWLTNLTSPDAATAQLAVATLRQSGPAGLQKVLQAYDRHNDPALIPSIESIAGQRGAVASRLYWYTDFDQAKAAAKGENKPILYLRMMGKLTDEYSCANSRFFRTVLYANATVSKQLRDQFILVWISERPVPVVTIDYGDGRVLKRTITGNSIHYVLAPDGRVIDALPGLYAPATFSALIAGARATALSGSRIEAADRQYLDRTADGLLRAWQADSGLQVMPTAVFDPDASVNNTALPAGGKNPPARVAMRRAFGKSAVEAPLVVRLTPAVAAAVNDSIDKADGAVWEKVAGLHAAEAKLDAASVAVIRGQNPQAYKDPAALDRVVANFQRLIALDTAHNNYQLRRQILNWLRANPGKLNIEDLNQRVYSELFLTPKSDPWLGLVPQDVYTALTCDGCVVTTH